MAKILIVLAVAAVASAAPSHNHEVFTSAVNPEEAIAAPAAVAARVDNDYQFSYSVSDPLTGDHKDQVESSNGPIVQGRYSLIEPDGLSRRVVDYSADDATGFNAIVHNEPAVQPAFAPAVRAEVAVPAAPAQPIAYPAVRAQSVAVQHQYAVAPAVRAQPVAIEQRVVAPAAFQTHHVAYTPTTQISYQPVVRTKAYVAPPAVSSQTVSHTSRTVHPQTVVYNNQVENVPVATPGLRADHYIQTHVAPAVTHQVAAIAPEVRADIAPAAHAGYGYTHTEYGYAQPTVGRTYIQPASTNLYHY